MNTTPYHSIDSLEDLKRPLPEIITDVAFGSDNYPYAERMKFKKYEKQLAALQIELVKLQYHVRKTEQRIVVIFEGRDAAGKGGTIKRFRENLNPRHAHVVALSKPTDTEQGEWYFQRYIRHFPTAGDIALFDRSWYNRAGVERVFGFCTEQQSSKFLVEAPEFERMLIREGIILFKFWLTVGREMQLKRFHKRAIDPLKTWKLSPIDISSLDKWEAYTLAKQEMMAATHTADAPWTVIKANDKRRARINTLSYFLNELDYEHKDETQIPQVDTSIVGSGIDEQ